MARIISYNENKVKAGQAVCLLASGFIKEGLDLSFSEKLRRLEKLTELNQRTRVNSLHISLNFDPSERLADEQLKLIADDYLSQIGFGEQPFLVYRHEDAAHPHLHLVTTNIRPDGSAITLHNLAKRRSEPARLAIEKKYGLVPAESKQRRAALMPEAVDASRVLYGRSETKKAVGKVLNYVLKNYRYASLPELNAVLGLYRVVADQGTADSRVRQHDGLQFRVLDADGNKTGPPLKASLFAAKPTLKNLRLRFERNKVKPADAQRRLRTAIDLALHSGKLERADLVRSLEQQGIAMVFRQNEAGSIYGVTYVDHVSRVVLNGSDLGKNYSAKAILECCQGMVAGEGKKQDGQAQPHGHRAWRDGRATQDGQPNVLAGEGKKEMGSAFVDTLLDPGYQSESMDWEFKRTKRKKKRRLSPG